MKKVRQNGFAALELLLVLAVVVAVGLVGYKVYNRSNSKASESNSSSVNQAQKQASGLTTVPEVKDKSDLDKASAALDQNDTTGANASDDNTLQSQASDN